MPRSVLTFGASRAVGRPELLVAGNAHRRRRVYEGAGLLISGIYKLYAVVNGIFTAYQYNARSLIENTPLLRGRRASTDHKPPLATRQSRGRM